MVTTDLATSRYADRARELMRAAQKLRDIGAQALMDVPRIAVIGGQSAGKSSLVEAVSGIRVPRDGGTCTRCPMEVNLINTPGQWKCRITLRFVYDSFGVPLADVQLIPFGSPLTSVDEVELTLRRAQAAILNHPREHSDLFLPKSRDELEYYRSRKAFENGTLKFSKNVVVVDIFDKDCANLSFVDLPGLIQNDEQQTVQLVEDLVKSNIQGNCLILVAIPMSDDMENQRAMRIALEADQDKSRTIGVLTKPDTLTSGAISARKKWRDMLTGNNKSGGYALKLGYYCVKLADDAERECNPSRTERDESEFTFFSTTLPWSAVPDRKHFGVSNLVTDLSKYLTAILDDMLPKLRKQAQEQLDEARAALQQLPAPPLADVSSEVLERVTNFCQEVCGTVHGTINMTSGVQNSGHSACCGKSFIHRNRAIYTDFKRKIRSTAPDFRPFEKLDEYNKPCFQDSERFISEEGVGNGPRDLLYVRKTIKESITWELPNNVPFDAKHALIDEFTKEWDTPTFQCFEEVYQNLTTCLGHILHRHFDRFQRLNSHIGDLVRDLLDGQKQFSYSFIDASLKQEKHPLYTQNEHYFLSLRVRWLAEYTEARMNQDRFWKHRSSGHVADLGDIFAEMPIETAAPPFFRTKMHERASPPSPPPVEPSITRALRALRELGYTNVTRNDLPRLRTGAPDAFSEELAVMADVRAYFFVAYKRIIDNVPLAIEHMLNQGLAESMKRNLLQKLNLGASDATKRLKDLMEEDPDIAQKREELTMKIQRLEKIETELRILLT